MSDLTTRFVVTGHAGACATDTEACQNCALAALTHHLSQRPQARLGFTDLEENEALLIWLCRRWYDGCARRQEIEAEIARDMAHDAYAAVLLYLFALLAALEQPDQHVDPGWPLLSAQEIRLLNLLGAAEAPTDVAELPACHGALAAAGIRIRPSRKIFASGRDALNARIDSAHPLGLRAL